MVREGVDVVREGVDVARGIMYMKYPYVNIN